MKVVFIVYHDILVDRIDNLLAELKIDYYTEWENVKGRGHHTEAHLGTRTFPGYNAVRMIALQSEDILLQLTNRITAMNNDTVRNDDKIRLFQVPLERIV
ncbi:MAG: PG0541 family transporter-associated protein [Ignavibacteriaceae bacterium]